jgi:hypothetical protein
VEQGDLGDGDALVSTVFRPDNWSRSSRRVLPAWQNGIVESFNGRLRDELLSSEIFATLDEARLRVDRWRLHYNHRRIQRASGKLTPAAFAAACLALPPLWLAPLACAAAPPGMEEAATKLQLS